MSNKVKPVKLDWKKFGNYEDIIALVGASKTTGKGVYLWMEEIPTAEAGVDISDQEESFPVINYIGKHECDILSRNKYHIFQQLGLNYPIPLCYLEKEFSGLPPFLPNGWYERVKDHIEDYFDYLKDLEKSSKIRTCAISYLENINIYYCETDKTAETPKNIERNLIYQLQPMDNRLGCGSPAPEKNRLEFEHLGELKDIDKYFENTKKYLMNPRNKRFGNRWGDKKAKEISARYEYVKKSW